MSACPVQDQGALSCTSSSNLLFDEKSAPSSPKIAEVCFGDGSDVFTDMKSSMGDSLDGEEEEIWNSSNLNIDEKICLVDLLHCKTRQMKINADLQNVLYAHEDSNANLELENKSLKDQIKSMKPSVLDGGKLVHNMDDIHAALAEKERATRSLMANIRKLEKENKTMYGQIAAINDEISAILPKRETDQKKITDLSQIVQTLEQKLQEKRLQLAERDEIIHQRDCMIDSQKASLMELNTTGEQLKSNIKDLESQWEFEVVTEGGSFLNLDGSFSLAPTSPLSLAEEFSMIPGLLESMDAPQHPDNPEDEIGDVSQQEVEVGVTCEKVKEVKTDLAELKAMEVKQAQHSENSVSWLGEAWGHFKRGAWVGAAVGLGVLLPLSLLSLATPSCSTIPGLDCMDVLWTTARHIVQPYCDVQHFGMPPF
ncbi:uncharacterized protein LOC125309936 isoform X1 [Alosa alosa]|uniref:uncharacterized protein LOC125309936 isoform X1 n=1 Tax=Alosa alosa TaxID=278164 RepID=UPI002015405F|nr:uncharacterized protein LOC125309936 isoform X1 [Alosa alosa]